MTSNTTNLGAPSPLPEGGKSLRIPIERTLGTMNRRMRLARNALEFSAVLAALVATMTSAVFALEIGMVPHTVAVGGEITGAFLKAASFVEQSIRLTGHLPTKQELKIWRADKGPWVSQIELEESPKSNLDLNARVGQFSDDAFVLSLWRGEWSEYYVQGRGTTVDSATGLYSSAVGIALGACGVSVLLWRFARKLRRAMPRQCSDS